MSIEVRFSQVEENKDDRRYEIVDGEVLDGAVKRALEGVTLGENRIEDLFHVVHNGHIIEPDFWKHVCLSKDDKILIAPIIRGGDPAQTFRQIAILTIAVAAATILGPAVALSYGAFAGGMAAAGATIAATLALNALIPPPVPDLGSGVGGDISQSQVYSISGQSNNVKQYGFVPKVYGRHRVFPNVAANPYTQLEVDPETGEIAQYLYAIYDFGLGPMTVDNIQIGETDIYDFDDFQFSLVDPNRPTTSEGSWDDATTNQFRLYKADNNVQAISVTLDGNQNEGGPSSEWQATRSTTENPDSLRQEIVLGFVNPQGLYAYSSSNQLVDRRIELQVEFREEGTTQWRFYNDDTYVDSYRAVGSRAERLQYTNLTPVSNLLRYTVLNISAPRYPTLAERTAFNLSQYTMVCDKTYGIRAGANSFYMADDLAVVPGQTLLLGKTTTLQGNAIIGSVSRAGGEMIITTTAAFSTDVVVYRGIVLSTSQLNTPISGSIKTAYQFKTVLDLTGRVVIERDETSPVYSEVAFVPKIQGKFEVRITRLQTTSVYTAQTSDSLTWYSINTRFDKNPIATDKRHVFLEVRMRATNQLNGTIQNLNALCTSVLDVWNGSAWVKQVTTNPAWVFADLLTGEVNKKAIAKSRLDTASLLAWANFCAEVPTPPPSATYVAPRFQCNFILDYPTTLQEVLGQVTSAAQASLNIVDGKYGVLIDKLVTTPVQVFTPRNSRNFQSSRIYSSRPHALRVKYVDSGADWEVRDVTVYDDGYDLNTATEFEDITTFACTSKEQAWRFGRYMLAQNRLRQENISIEVDFEHLVCTRGDYVQITQDVMRVGGKPARVKSVAGNRVVIDDAIETDNLLSYGYVARRATGAIVTGTVTPVLSDTFDLTGTIPSVGDLIVIGTVGTVVYDCIVRAISPNDDLTATISLVEKADDIYSAESTTTLPAYDPEISPASSPNIRPPKVVRDLVLVDNAWTCANGEYQHYIDIDWDAPTGSVYETFEVYVDDGTGFNLVNVDRKSSYRHIVDNDRLDIEHKFRVLAVSATGRKLEIGVAPEVTATPASKTAAPSDVESLSIDITGEVLQLVWPRVEDCDIREYQIRYSTEDDGDWLNSIPLLTVDRNTTLASTQARTGLYLIKAIDWNGNQSENEASAYTSVPELFNLNVVEDLTDTPGFGGRNERTEVLADSVFLMIDPLGDGTTYYENGYYYYENFVDLGDIYTARIQSSLRAVGFNNDGFMADWPSLELLDQMASALSSDWDVEVQYRSSEFLETISDWVTLDAIDFIAGGNPENFTPWRKFIMGDATGRIFQFRMKLTSYRANVTPRVLDSRIRVDMPDRVDSYENLVSSDTVAYELEYDPPFKGPGTSPNVQVTIDNGESGDYWSFDSKTLNGFEIRIFDKTDVQVSRQFDVVVKGYGRKSAAVI